MVKIITLGDFDILINNSSIMDEVASQKRIIKLFKYFLVHEDKKLLPEDIIEDLWAEEDFKNPLNMLRTQISRLRNILDNKTTIESFFNIKYVNGYYIFKLKDGCAVDFIDFENLLEKDFQSIKKEVEKDYIKFRDVLLTYKGRFLGEIGNEDWLIPIINRYSRLYVKGISYYLDYLKENLMYTEIINICEKAIKIKPYEEVINLNFMDALVNLKQQSYALIHYEFYTRRLFNDLGIAPSKKLTQLYKKIRQKEDENSDKMSLNQIDNEMTKEFDFGGVLFCDIENFKFLYNYERRNKERRQDKSVGIGIGIVSIFSGSHNHLTKKELKKGMDSLGYVFFKTFRQGDIVAKWNENQMLVMLYAMKEEYITIVVDKLRDNFDKEKLDDRLQLNIKVNIL